MNQDTRFIEWVRMYSERLVRIAFIYMRDQALAEDRVQEAFLKAYKAIDQLHDVENPFPWFAKIVVNDCKSAKRKSWREMVATILPELPEMSAEQTFLQKSQFEEVHDAVLSLPEKYRLPIILFHFEGLSIQEMAQVLGIKPETTKTRLVRGRQRLQKLLEGCESLEHGGEASRSKTI